MATHDILILDSVTQLGPACAGATAIAASHGGVYAAHYSLQAGVTGLVLNDAGIGLDDAGIGGLSFCDDWTIPCAVVDHRSARIGDGADCARRGSISFANAAATALGVTPGMGAREAAERMRAAHRAPVHPPALADEAKVQVQLPGAKRELILADSASLVGASDVGAVVFTGSHGGLLGRRPETAIKVAVFAALYNDAGVGIDDAGISRLPALDARDIAGATVSAHSARIGDARSAYETGLVSRVNRTAERLGARSGMTARAFAELMCAGR